MTSFPESESSKPWIPVDPAAIELPPTQPIDITDLIVRPR